MSDTKFTQDKLAQQYADLRTAIKYIKNNIDDSLQMSLGIGLSPSLWDYINGDYKRDSEMCDVARYYDENANHDGRNWRFTIEVCIPVISRKDKLAQQYADLIDLIEVVELMPEACDPTTDLYIAVNVARVTLDRIREGVQS